MFAEDMKFYDTPAVRCMSLLFFLLFFFLSHSAPFSYCIEYEICDAYKT